MSYVSVVRPGRLVGEVVVPARPRGAAARQQARVGVEHGLVSLVADRAEDLGLRARRVGEQSERAVGVNREHDLVEALVGVVEADGHRVVVADDVAHRRPQVHALAERRDQRLHVAARAAADRAPGGAAAQLQHAVVVEEFGQEAAGKLHICSGSADQIADAWGTSSRSTKYSE